jgi:glutaredoxin/glutathione-dependent peroxiredoxin
MTPLGLPITLELLALDGALEPRAAIHSFRRSPPMSIKVGDRMPEGKFKVMTESGPKDMTTAELFQGKRVVLFSVPGAFTPTCSAKHLPGYVGMAPQLKAKGVDTIACLAVNDAFVMGAWGKASSCDGKVLMLADGNGDYTRALGLELDARGHGLGMRGQRFALVAEDGTLKQLNVEAPGQFKVSAAEHVLAQL